MTEPIGTDAGRGGHRARGPFEPLETLDDAQRQAFDAAIRVAGELTALGADLTGASWFGDAFARGSNDGSSSAADSRSPIDVGRLRGDVVRAAETFSELMRALLDVGFDAMDELARRTVPRPAASAPPGRQAKLECVVRNDRHEPVRRVRPRVQQFTSDDGTVLDATVTVRPGSLDLEQYERATVGIDVGIRADARVGRYHGLLLVAGLPDAAYAITVEVVDQEEDLENRDES